MLITLPWNFTPRDYQIPMLTAREKGYKREVYILHRRAGKDLTAINDCARAVMQRIGIYYYLFPTFAQARKVIFDGMTGEGRKFISYFPSELIESTNATEMKITFKNGSIFQIVGTDNFDSIRGTNCIGAIFSEYAQQDQRAWETIEPILLENGGWAKFLYTPNGKNHGWQLYNFAKSDPEWFTMLLTIEDTKKSDGTPVITLDQINSLRRRGVSEEFIQQEYYCSFTMGTEGAYYAKLMENARTEGRIRRVPYDDTLPVHTAWDVGVSDFTSIIFYQRIFNEYHHIDYLENQGEGIQYYARKLQDKAREKGYVYGNHYVPHDLKARVFSAEAKTQMEVARGLGLNFQLVPKHALQDGIQACRNLIPKSWFDEEATKLLIDHLDNYTKSFNQTNKVWMDTPKHDEHSHGADAFRQEAMADKSPIIYNPMDISILDNTDYIRKHSSKYHGY
jgi:phage terminase large subunit